MQKNESVESIIQNLKDAGCDCETIEKFMVDLKKGKEASGLKRLAAHRKNLLNSLHQKQKCIDCLDYLVYQIKKQTNNGNLKGVHLMKTIVNKRFDEERALYAAQDTLVKDCNFDGPADGESAFKEGRDVAVDNCFFNLRYPFWHNTGLKIQNSEMTELCRAALWYSENVEINSTKLHGIKALRECANIKMRGCDIVSPEFGWSVRGIEMEDCTAESEYFMMRSDHLTFHDVRMKGKYSFQYITDSVFENCLFDTKDAFWHAKNITVRNSVIKGEYLAWYSENITFENCKIIGTQPLCYCKNLKLVNCEMVDTDLSFERSDVEATITVPIVSIKNPLSGHIYVPEVGEIIMDFDKAKGEVIVEKLNCKNASCACCA